MTAIVLGSLSQQSTAAELPVTLRVGEVDAPSGSTPVETPPDGPTDPVAPAPGLPEGPEPSVEPPVDEPTTDAPPAPTAAPPALPRTGADGLVLLRDAALLLFGGAALLRTSRNHSLERHDR